MKQLTKSKYIFITGGVLSSLGKGISSASLGYLLQSRGYSVTIQKFDPYLNNNPGMMSPLQHGEIFVTDDGAETDLDLGHYERFLGRSLHQNNTHSSGRIYWDVLSKERKDGYAGKTVQVIPHITNEVKKRMKIYDGQFDFILIEIGGTVGDIESMPFLETQRQMNYELSVQDVVNIHLTYIPYLRSSSELKTKPTQHSVHTLMQHGIRPDVLLCRTEEKLNKEIRQKIGLFCNVNEEAVIEVADVETTIYEVPLTFKKSGLDEIILKKLNLPINELDIDKWQKFVTKIKKPSIKIRVGLVGKYTKYEDSYKSILEALVHAGSINNTRVEVELVNSEEITADNVNEKLSSFNGILVGPGFGHRGIAGKIFASQYARENNVPFFGIGLGMHCACIDFARNVCGIKNADSREFEAENKTDEFIIELKDKPETLRLGAYSVAITNNTNAFRAYKNIEMAERCRHRYEFNNNYIKQFEKAGMVFSGILHHKNIVGIIELPQHKWFMGVQFHPEYKSRAVTGHPLFIDFVAAMLKK
ncbi:MAG: CTP synthase [Bacteroidetes bacterium]|nr:CTP synthase [Bacteroidota bacterium]